MAADDENRSGRDGAVARAAGTRGRASARMLAIFDASPMATAITRLGDGMILFANPACLEMLVRQEDELVGRTMVEVGFGAWPERRDAMLERLAAEGLVRDVEQEVRTGGGETLTVLTSLARVELDDEPCLVEHIHDITERRRLEARLHEREERLRQITETFQQGFLLSDVDPLGVLYASPAVARIFGVDLDSLYRDPLALERLIHPDDLEDVSARRDAMTGATDFVFRIVRPDGETRWIRTRAEPVLTDDGRARIAAVSEDVTEERELREALRESEERFRLLAENSTDVIGRLSCDQRIEYISPASRAVYGYEPEAMIGRFGWEFVHPDDLAELHEDFSARPDRLGVITNSYRVRRPDGSFVWAEAKIRAIRDPVSGAVTEFHTVARDVGERKRAEAEVRRAKDEAEQANAAKSEFLSRMSHELRTPLHAILGFGELLERADLRPRQREQLTQITMGGRHLLELINEVLDLSRIERGELRLALEPVHVGQVVSEALQLLGPLAAARSVRLPVAPCEEHEIHVMADRQRLKQVLLNLLSNAVKYNRDGGDVRVSTARSSPRTARIEIIDSGIGIADDDLARAFAAFERLGAEATDVEGTGLGLALTKRLIEAMGGTIGVDSEVGCGTTFWLALPVADAPAAQPAATEHAPSAPGRRDTRSVLYIEDNASNIQLVEAILRARPEVALLVAERGADGLRMACEHRPALVLLDLNLPDMSGEEILRRLRSDPRTADVAVVILSADATPGQAARLRSAGAYGYLTKPFEIAQFLAIIDGLPAPDEPAGAEGPSPPGRPPGDAALDLSLLDKLRRLYPDGSAVKEFVDVFLQDSPARLDALRTAVADADAHAVRSSAHAWRGACSLTGAHRVAALLADVEDVASVGTIPDRDELRAVEAAYEEAHAALVEQFP
ncbi:MAG: hypothetical protein QOJ35_1929 [Solirubrobacteraceae bacterium]|nr:hypothetical protein [Solirubrobacteraceae bacterium]